eukprot:RCo050605
MEVQCCFLCDGAAPFLFRAELCCLTPVLCASLENWTMEMLLQIQPPCQCRCASCFCRGVPAFISVSSNFCIFVVGGCGGPATVLPVWRAVNRAETLAFSSKTVVVRAWVGPTSPCARAAVVSLLGTSISPHALLGLSHPLGFATFMLLLSLAVLICGVLSRS